MELYVQGVNPEPDPTLPDFVEIGAFTYYDRENIRFVAHAPDERIKIGKYCSIAYGVTIFVGGNHATDTVSTFPFDNILLEKQNPTRSYKTTPNTEIGNDVWLGYRVHVLGGANIGHGAVVAACAVVSGTVEPYAIVGGIPARLIRYRFSPQVIEKLLQIAWWDWPEERIRSNIEWFYRPVDEFIEHFSEGQSCAQS